MENESPNSRFVGALEHPIDYYRTHGRELYDLVNKRAWHGWERNRDCKNCSAGNPTRLVIQAIENADKDSLTGIPKYGLVRGRVFNIGDGADATTNIPAQNGWWRKPDEHYYIITDDNSPTQATLYIATVRFSRLLHHPKDKVQIDKSAMKYRRCPHWDEMRREKSEGDFRSCDKGFLPSLAMPWFSCDGGCCTAETAFRLDSTGSKRSIDR